MSVLFLQRESNRLKNTVQTTCLKFELLQSSDWDHKPLANKWSKKEELGHLIDSAANNHLRFVRAQLAETEFVSFAYEQNFFVSAQQYQQRPGSEILQLWKQYNLHLSHIINCINPSKLNIICKIGSYEPVTLEFLVKDYNDHLEHHLNRISVR